MKVVVDSPLTQQAGYTYIGERGTVSPLDATLNVEMDSGSNDTIAAYLVVTV